MNKRIYYSGLISLLLLLNLPSLFSQVKLKLQVQPDGSSWAVYARPEAGINPGSNTITGSGQVTIVAPASFVYSNLESHGGLWIDNAVVVSPIENPGKQYISFGLVNAEPEHPIVYKAGDETLLFTFDGESGCPDSLYLIDCLSPTGPDPFCLPNSISSNPGNDLAVIDFDAVPTAFYFYSGNYAQAAWSCADNDGDGIPNGQEDTNGNGVFDPFDDESDLNDPNDPGTGITGGLKYKLQLLPGGQSWGVYVKPNAGLQPTLNTITASARLNVVVPNGFEPDSITSLAGNWAQTSVLESPQLNPDRTYLQFDLVSDDPQITYLPDEETLLFTIHRSGDCPDSLYIVDVETDPVVLDCTGPDCTFNEIMVADLGASPSSDYFFDGVYGHSAWSCHDCDGDGILNAFEDTNGDGVWTPDEDESQLCNPCDPLHPLSATLEYNGDLHLCSGQSGQNFLSVQVEGGWGPAFQITYTDGTDIYTVNDYLPETPVPVVPFNGATYQLIAVTDQFGCQVEAGSLSGSFTVQVDGPVTFVQQPENITECAGSSVIFETIAMNPGSGAVSYQWERSCDDGQSWEVLLDNPAMGIAGAGTAALHLGDAAANLNDCLFRLMAQTSVCSPVYSDNVSLHLEGPVTFSQQPQDAMICAGSQVCFETATLAPLSGDIQFQWEVLYPGNATWSAMTDNFLFAGSQSAQLCIANGTGLNGTRYRVSAFTDLCGPVFSEEVLLTVEGPLLVQDQPDDLEVSAGEDAFFEASIDNFGYPGAVIEYRWQESTDGGLTWTNLSEGAAGGNTYLGTTSTQLTISPADGLWGNLYRLSASTQNCEAVFTQPAMLLEKQLSLLITGQPEDQAVCENGRALFTVSATSNDGSAITYQWESSENGMDWESIGNNAIFNGSQSDTLIIQSVAGLDSTLFRCIVSTGSGENVSSASAFLLVQEMVTVTLLSEDATVCLNEGHSFIAETGIPDDQPAYTLQWQVSSDEGLTWAPLQNGQETGFGGTYQGVDSELLEISLTEGLDNNLYRIVAETGSCRSISEPVRLFVDDAASCFPTTGKVDMKLALHPTGKVWGVWIRPADDYVPSGYQKALSGRVTIAVSKGYNLLGLSSKAGGTWNYGSIVVNTSQSPHLNFFTFDLTPGNNSMDLFPGEEIMLFSFDRNGPCPEELFILEETPPAGVMPNDLTIVDIGNGNETVGIGQVYGHGEEDCGNLQLVTIYEEEGNETWGESLASPVVSEMQVNGQDTERTSLPQMHFMPNPAFDHVRVEVPAESGELILMNTAGQMLQNLPMQNNLLIDLTDYPAGLYFLIGKVDGQVKYREKIVKR